ncbi:hypothetical protein LJC08_00630 [Methanimicrococcus sp. OttesenSCG-928-J09]|nr:hypothetical protein [Methanimicrococcus sp. OttesenSCG-928-J09]
MFHQKFRSVLAIFTILLILLTLTSTVYANSADNSSKEPASMASPTVQPPQGKAEMSDPITFIPDPATIAFLAIAGIAAAIIAYFILSKS